MKDVCELINGRAYSKNELLESGKYRVLRVGNFFTNNHWYWSDLELEPSKYCENGDLLYAWSASFGPRIWRDERCIYHYHIWKVRPFEEIVTRDFLFYFFEWDKERIRAEQGAGATMVHVSKQSMEARNIPVPPLDEQKRIVAALDQAFAALDRARANDEANLADAEALFDAWLTQLFRERPPTWRTERLHALCDQITVGHVGPMADRYSARGIPFLRSQNIRPFEISMIDVKSIDEQFHGELAKSALRPGDVAIVRTGYPGTAAVIPSSLPVSNCADLVIARPGELISPDFLVMFLNSSFGKTLVAEKSVGAAQKHFNVGAAREAELPFPDRAEQDRLVQLAAERRDVARGLSEAYRVKHSDIAELRQSLLQAAFSGQLS